MRIRLIFISLMLVCFSLNAEHINFTKGHTELKIGNFISIGTVNKITAELLYSDIELEENRIFIDSLTLKRRGEIMDIESWAIEQSDSTYSIQIKENGVISRSESNECNIEIFYTQIPDSIIGDSMGVLKYQTRSVNCILEIDAEYRCSNGEYFILKNGLHKFNIIGLNQEAEICYDTIIGGNSYILYRKQKDTPKLKTQGVPMYITIPLAGISGIAMIYSFLQFSSIDRSGTTMEAGYQTMCLSAVYGGMTAVSALFFIPSVASIIKASEKESVASDLNVRKNGIYISLLADNVTKLVKMIYPE